MGLESREWEEITVFLSAKTLKQLEKEAAEAGMSVEKLIFVDKL